MKKILSLVVTVALLVSLFVGCSSDTDEVIEANGGDTKTETSKDDSGKTETETDDAEESLSGTITVITNRTDLLQEDAGKSLFDYAAEFNAIYPDITVEFEGLTDYQGQISIRMNTEEYGDVLMVPSENLTKDQLSNFFEPLGTVEEMEKKYLWITEQAYDGTVYGVPHMGAAQGIVYNKEVFAAAGVDTLPTSPEEFIEALEKIKANDVIPYYTNYAAGWPLGGQWESQAPSLGGDPNWQNTVSHTDAPWSPGEPYYILSKTLFDIVAKELSEPDPTTTDWEGSKGMLARGEIGCMVLGSWSISQMQDAATAEGIDPSVIGYMPFPYTNADGNIYAASGGDYCMGINTYSENKAAARAWLDWFIDESSFTVDQGGISPVIGNPMPETLKAFEDLGVVYVSNAPAPAGEETFLDDVDTESEIGRWSEAYRMRLVEAAIGNTGETFEDVMDDLNARWKAARESLGIN